MPGPQKAPEDTASRRTSIWSVPYVAACFAQLACYANNSMIQPVIPLYLTDLGESTVFVGFTLLAFSVSSFTLRPLIGRAVDQWTPRGVQVLGSLVLAATSWVYVIPNIPLFVVARATQGVGWAAVNTAGPVIATDVTPDSKRGEALGVFGMMRGASVAFAPALGLRLLLELGPSAVFIASAGFAVVSAAVSWWVPDRVKRKATPRPVGDSFWAGLIERRVLLPGTLNFILSAGQAIVISFSALYARERGIEGVDLFYLIGGITAVGAVYCTRFSDNWGRAPVIAFGFTTVAMGLGIMAISDSTLPFILGGILFNLGSGITPATMMALTIDKAPISRRGAAMATFTAAFQMGAGFGGLIWGTTIAYFGFTAMFVAGVCVQLFGLALLLLNWKDAGPPVRRPPARQTVS